MRKYTKTQALAKIQGLVTQFAGEVAQLKKAPKVKEAQIEDKYIKPLFRFLNWNTANEGLPLLREEFIVQASQRVDLTMKAPDYLLRLPDKDNSKVMRKHLFIAAKHPKHDLVNDVRWIRQTYQYAHSTLSETDRSENRVRLAVLTDFEEFRLFDCVDPSPLKSNDSRGFAKRVVPGFEWTYLDYVGNFDRLWATFERDSVQNGSLDALWVTREQMARQRSAPDELFLADLEAWRLSIANSMLRLDSTLTDSSIAAATQLFLDRIVFVKMLYDRGIEVDFLSNLVKGLSPSTVKSDKINLYDACADVFKSLNRIYNGTIFHRRPELDSVHVESKIIYDILTSLQPDRAIYTFAAMPVEIIGYAYEQFLAKVIQRNGKRMEAEPKPEVRRARGVYYTPRHVVEYIVDSTLGEALKLCGTPDQVRGIKVLDPACGSGSFLIVAYEKILQWYAEWFVEQIPGWTTAQGRVAVPEQFNELVYFSNLVAPGRRDVRLRPKLKKQILLDNIFGVDIDSQAVEVTCFSLSMKALEDADNREIHVDADLFRMRILPDFRENIKCGNSLISVDVRQRLLDAGATFNLDDRTATNAFDWKKEFPAIMKRGGFDVVLGNPPYDVVEKERGEASWPHWVLTSYVNADTGEYKNALGGKTNLFRFFIIRSLMLTRDGGRYGMIVPMALLADISCAKTRRHLLLTTKNLTADCFPQKDNAARRIFRDAKLSTVVFGCEKSTTTTQDTSQVQVRVYPWDSFDDAAQQCMVRLSDAAFLDPKNVPIPLVDEVRWKLCLKLHRHPRVKRLGDMQDFKVTRGEINQTNFRDYITSDPRQQRMLKGSEIAAYRLQEPKQGEREWFDEARYLKGASGRKRKTKPVIKLPRIATQRITGVDESRRLVAVAVDPPAYFADSTNSIISVDGGSHSLEYLLGLLNSRLWNWRFRLTSTNNNVGTNELDCMPVRSIDPRDKTEGVLYGHLMASVSAIQAGYAELATATGTAVAMIEREIESAKGTVEEIIKQLYDLSDADWGVVMSPYRSVFVEDGEDGEDA